MATSLPCLVTEDGHTISSSVVIARYLASFKDELLGKTDFEKGQVDAWMYFLRDEVQPVSRAIAYQVFGHVQVEPAEHTYTYNLLKDNLKILNNHLKQKKFIVG